MPTFSQTFNSHSPHKRSAKEAFGPANETDKVHIVGSGRNDSADAQQHIANAGGSRTYSSTTPAPAPAPLLVTTEESTRRRLAAPSVHSSTHSFLPCHLRILKALYNAHDDDNDRHSNGDGQECEPNLPDNYNVWDYIVMFLQRRRHMEYCNTKTNNLSGILTETKRVLARTNDTQSIKKVHYGTHPISAITTPKSGLTMDRKQYHHPVVLSFCTQPQQVAPDGTYSSAGTPSADKLTQSFLSLTSPPRSKRKRESFPSYRMMTMASFSRFNNKSQDPTHDDHGFNFLAFNYRMLRKWHAASDRMIKKEFLEPFLPLVKDVKERIDALEKEHEVCQSEIKEWERNDDSIDYDSFSQAREFEEDKIQMNHYDDQSETMDKLCDLRLKLDLWKRLNRSIDAVLF